MSPKHKISTMLAAPVICANEDEFMSCSLVERCSLSNDEEEFLSAKGDMDESSQSLENENFATLDEDRKFTDFQETETQADQSQDGICKTHNSIEHEAKKVDTVAENTGENGISEHCDTCDTPSSASENDEKGGVKDKDKIGATCTESSHLDGPLEDQTVSECFEGTDSQENIDPTELQPSISNSNIVPKNVDGSESNLGVLNNREVSRTEAIEAEIVEEEISNTEEQLPSTSASAVANLSEGKLLLLNNLDK